MLKRAEYNNILRFIKENPETDIGKIQKAFAKYSHKKIEIIIRNLHKEGYISGMIYYLPMSPLIMASNLIITIKGEEILTSKIFRFLEWTKKGWNWISSIKLPIIK